MRIRISAKFRSIAVLAAAVLMAAIFASALGACEKGTGEDGAVTGSASGSKTSAVSSAAAKTTSAVKSTAAKTTPSAASGSQAILSAGTGSSENTVPQADSAAGATDGTQEDGQGDGSSADAPDGITAEKTYDLKGREIRFVVHMDTLIPTDSTYSVGGPKLYHLMKEAEEKFNCKFTFTVKNEALIRSELTNSVLAGVYYSDVIRCNGSGTLPLETNNIIMPINDYIDLNIPYIRQYDNLHWHGLRNPQNVYALFRSVFQGPSGVWYDNNLLGREGIPDLKEYYNNGTWDWSTYLDLAIKLTKDLNGDGIIDQWGTGSTSFNDFTIKMMWSNGAKMISYSGSDKRYYYSLGDPAANTALQFVTDLFHIYQVVPNKNCLNDFLAGKVGMLFYEDWRGMALANTNGRPDLGFVTMPHGPDNPSADFGLTAGGHFFYYPSNIANPGDVIQSTSYWIACWDESKSNYFTIEDMVKSEAIRYFYNDANINFYIDYMKYHKQIKDFTTTFSPAQSRIQTAIFAEMIKTRRSAVPLIMAMEDEINSIIAGYMGY